MKIATIIGTRPNFIKCAPVSYEIRKDFEEILIHTGQHYDYEMNKIFFDELGIPKPDYHLNIGSDYHGYQTGMMLSKIEDVLMKIKPNVVLVYGDCNTTLAGALAAAKLNIQIAHVEAGLRSFDKTMPEEINRVVTDHCSNLLFCPTKTSITNLKNEGIKDGAYLTGDVMVDSLFHNIKIAEKSNILNDLKLKSKNYFVLTLHRASNTDNEKNLRNIMETICEINEQIVFPVHPRTEKFLKKYNLNSLLKKQVILTKPQGYFDFLKLTNNAKMILTDSGGLQKESYIMKVPCLTLRDNTEWIETIEDGWNILVGTNKNKIIKAIEQSAPKKKQKEVFGRGNAAYKICQLLQESKSRF